MTSSLLSASLLPLQVDQNIQMFLFPLSLARTWNTCKPLHDDFPFPDLQLSLWWWIPAHQANTPHFLPGHAYQGKSPIQLGRENDWEFGAGIQRDLLINTAGLGLLLVLFSHLDVLVIALKFYKLSTSTTIMLNNSTILWKKESLLVWFADW